jgi:Leucine-rich repeat (LRR) protein
MISINGKKVNKDIKKLDLTYNNITQLPIEIVQLTRITTLSLAYNKLTQLPGEIGQLTQLTTLYLQNNNLTQVPVEIGQLVQLTTLYLCNNKLTHLPVEIGQLAQLTILYLSNNNLTQVPVEIGQLAQLITLNLCNNKLTNLPVEIGQLIQLGILYLSNNKLTHLPVEIGHLTQLHTLYLRDNNITQLPVEIGNLSRLTTLYLQNNKLTHLPVEIGHLIQLTSLYLSDNPVENLLNPIIQRVIQRIENRPNGNTIYSDTQNVHSSSIQQSIRDSINNLMNAFIVDYPLTYLDWSVLNQKTKEIITEYMDCNDIHTMLNITFKELFIALVIELDKLSPDLQIEIQKRLNEEMQESECKCFTGRISRLVNCLSGYSDKVNIQITENEEINNIISVIMSKRGLKTIAILKEEMRVALTERGYSDEKIAEWLEYVDI